MLRKEVANYIGKFDENIVYLVSSNKNLDIYYEQVEDIEKIKLVDLQENDEYIKKNSKLIELLESDKKYIIFLSIEGLLKKYSVKKEILNLSLKDKMKRGKFERILEENGYEKRYLVKNRKEYSIRGDIVDIYPLNGENPIRIELFGEEIERLAEFDIYTQKSLKILSEYTLYLNIETSDKFTMLDMIEKFSKDKKIKKVIENKDIVDLKIEEAILRNRDNEDEIRKIYSDFLVKSKIIDVQKSENDLVLNKKDYSKTGLKYSNISEIREGDYIIHQNHGVGIFLGIENISGKDYLAIKYADEDRLFVPVDGLNKIEKYLVNIDKIPEIYNLGRKGFKKKREKLEKDMLIFAKELIEIQAKRELQVGFKFSKDTIWQEEFEEKFPYTETLDQKRAIEDVKKDMESSKIMDRIVCGDVGYGKTEVAIRATFKAIMDGKQVLIIVPTTVLAQQHYERFEKRFEDYPFTIKLLSRMISGSEQKVILKGLENGAIDIVIGTHRLLSKDIKFKDLGLIIVDEEQKFGVKAKEILKKYRSMIDMLTLTATPIPRTLNYAMLGIRDISIIDTAPEGRVPVEISFLEKENKNIRDIIMKEIARDGQVFYIYNKVEKMDEKLNEIKKIVPKYVVIKKIHGKMPSQEIKRIVREFEQGEIDILLSTTIVENGIDIENANTILIENIDRLGLSQVYQLKGRVGRGKRKGYCYILVDKDKHMGKKATERREILKELGEFGGGFKLSLEDMRIRGAGELLGEKQHGALETFGYNLYNKMLQDEINRQKGIYIEKKEINIVLEGDANIPKNYISDDVERLKIYKRLVGIENRREVDELKIELRDRFGDIPKELDNLFRYILVKIEAVKEDILEIIERKDEVLVKFENEKLDLDRILKLIKKGIIKYSEKENGIIYEGEILKFINIYREERDDGEV